MDKKLLIYIISIILFVISSILIFQNLLEITKKIIFGNIPLNFIVYVLIFIISYSLLFYILKEKKDYKISLITSFILYIFGIFIFKSPFNPIILFIIPILLIILLDESPAINLSIFLSSILIILFSFDIEFQDIVINNITKPFIEEYTVDLVRKNIENYYWEITYLQKNSTLTGYEYAMYLAINRTKDISLYYYLLDEKQKLERQIDQIINSSFIYYTEMYINKTYSTIYNYLDKNREIISLSFSFIIISIYGTFLSIVKLIVYLLYRKNKS